MRRHVEEREPARRNGQFGAVLENALGVVRQNPVPVLLIAAGAGWLIYGMRKERTGSHSSYRRIEEEAEDIPVLNTGHARIYDPDASPRYPTQDSLESRREMSARA